MVERKIGGQRIGRYVYSNIEPFTCVICQKMFYRNKAKKNSSRSTSVRGHSCITCSKKCSFAYIHIPQKKKLELRKKLGLVGRGACKND